MLKARVVKTATGFHKMVYQDTTCMINNLIEAITNRNKEFKKKREEE